MSYTHQEFIVDLTQVTATSGPNSKVRSLAAGNPLVLFPCVMHAHARPSNASQPVNRSQPEILHELEVELKDSAYLLSLAAKRGDPGVPQEEAGQTVQAQRVVHG